MAATVSNGHSGGVSVLGTGSYLPSRVMTNADIEKIVETSDDWITSRTGIKERRIAAEGEHTSDLGAAAARLALEQAGVTAEEVDLILVATASPDMFFPSTACVIQSLIGARKAAAMDISAACSGFLYALEMARHMIAGGAIRYALIVGAEKLSAMVDWSDRNTCVLFGDGAGAVVLGARQEGRGEGILTTYMASDGDFGSILGVPGGGTRCRITEIEGPAGPLTEAFASMAVSISLADDIDISRGDMIARPNNQPHVTQDFDATVCWMSDDAALEPGRDYVIKHTTRTTRARVTALDYRLDVNTLHRDKSATALKINELGRVTLRTQVPLLLDEYARNAAIGSFILIDPDSNGTVAAGMVRDTTPAATRTATPNAVRHQNLVTAEDRLSRGSTVWFTGLSGSGKSSVAMLVEQKLLELGRPAYVLDGDNLRHGLNADLGFTMADRAENLRRLAHIATLLADSGQIVLVPAISPLEEHRALARKVHEDQGYDFFEVFCDTPLQDCERRDPKGLYAKARRGEITHFTGIDSPYQRPKKPDLRLTPDCDVTELAQHVIDMIDAK